MHPLDLLREWPLVDLHIVSNHSVRNKPSGIVHFAPRVANRNTVGKKA